MAEELASTAQCVVQYPLGLVEPAVTTGRPSQAAGYDTPVLLVHGYAHNQSGWWTLDRRLREAGYTSVHRMNYLPLGSGVPALAERLAQRVEEVRAVAGAQHVDVVAHSLGGILLRWYVQELGGDRIVRTAITLATPHGGTQSAYLWPERTARQIRPGSALMRRLTAGARPEPVRWVAFWSRSDMLVWPHEAARLHVATNIEMRGVGHLSFLLAPRVTRAIVGQLRQASIA
jgi:triacylglycerol esterase/lipase EstA (alpha/beta hydrolase family)